MSGRNEAETRAELIDPALKDAGWEEAQMDAVSASFSTWDPRKQPSESFEYIDVSSVCRKSLEITETTMTLGSEAPSRARRVVKSGDVIFATIRPTLKRIAIIPPELDGAICSTGYFVIRPSESLLSKYVFYYLNSGRFLNEMEALQRGASYPAVSDRDVKNHRICFPSLSEQERIVAVLDEAFEAIDTAIANTEKNLANTEELFQSILDQQFNNPDSGESEWRRTTIGDLCEVISGQSPKGEYYNDIGDGMPFHQGKKEFTEKYIGPAKKWTTHTTKEAYPNDVLMSVRAPVGPVNLAVENICVGRGLAAIRAGEKLNYDFLFYGLLAMQNEITGKEGATFKSINREQICSLRFPTPSLSEQERIVAILDEANESVQALRDGLLMKLADLEELKQSVLEKAFSGELSDSVLEEAGV